MSKDVKHHRIVLRRSFKGQPQVSIRTRSMTLEPDVVRAYGYCTQVVVTALGESERPMSKVPRNYLIPYSAIRFIADYTDNPEILDEILARDVINSGDVSYATK